MRNFAIKNKVTVVVRAVLEATNAKCS